MFVPIIIAISFAIGFFIESIIGFGGGLIAYAILGFFIDIKQMILSGLYIGTCSSAYIFYTDRKSFDYKIFKSILPLSFIGVVIGVMIFGQLSPQLLSLFFGLVLLALSIKILFFETYILPKIFRNKLIFLGGISQGSFGIGGPFWVNALQNDFKTKSNLRTTMAMCFVFFNLIRVVQLSLQGDLNVALFADIWWVIIPVFAAVKLGYFLHLKMSVKFFKRMVALMTMLASFKFLLNFMMS